MAMAAFLNNVSIDTIKMLGRWKSTAVLDYIRPQILEAFHHTSAQMVGQKHQPQTPTASPTIQQLQDLIAKLSMKPTQSHLSFNGHDTSDWLLPSFQL
jgi:hypothetical protein